MPEDHTARRTPELMPLAPTRAGLRENTRASSVPTARVSEALFEIAVAAMWSDGALLASEVERGHAITRELRTQPRRGGSPFGAIAAGALPFGELEFDRLDHNEKRLAYAVAHWVTAASPGPSPRRAGFLRGVQLRMRLAEDEASMLRDVVTTVDETASDAATAFGLLLCGLCPLQ